MKDKVKIIAEAFTFYFLENHWEFFEDDELKHLINKVDLNRVNDKALVDNSYIRAQVDWSRVPRDKFVRCISRFIDRGALDFVHANLDLKSRNLQVKEVLHVIKRRPELVHVMGIDLKSLNTNDAFLILMLGKDYFLDEIQIEKHNFTYAQGFEIFKVYNFRKDILLKIPYQKFNNLQISHVLRKTGEEFIDYFDITKLHSIDWLYVLERKPELYDFLDPIMFLDCDIFNVVRAVELCDYPELHLILKSRITELTAYGIERLLVKYMNIYIDLVDLKRLDSNNVAKIELSHPGFQARHFPASNPKK